MQFHYQNIKVSFYFYKIKYSKTNNNHFLFVLGKTLLIVNTASFCGFTSQYPLLNKLKDHYSSDNFEILAFPCNQFALVSEGFIFLYVY
jgi:glutathione peroxidase